MTSITQTIPSFVTGISQQPDDLKLSGQVNDMVNVIPDVTAGLTKRPGSKFVSTLTGATSNGAWFSYFRDETEGAYIGQVDSSGAVRMWTTAGVPCSVTNNVSSYLASNSPETQLKFLTVNDYTFVTNTQKTAAMSNTLSPTRQSLTGYAYNAFVELKQLAPGRQYSLDISTPGSSIQDLDSARGKATRIGFSGTPAYATTVGGGGMYIRVDPNLPNMGSQVFTVSSVNGKNISFRLTVTGQVAVDSQATGTVDADDYAGVYDRKLELLYGGHGWSAGETFSIQMNGVYHTIEVKEIAVIKCRCNIGSFRPKPTSLESGQELSAESILSQYNDPLLGTNRSFSMTGSGVTVSAVPVGNGLFLYSANPFTVTTSETDLWRIIQHEVNDVTNLPIQCKHNYLVKVVNSRDSNNDDYYLKFVGANNSDGSGSWQETVAPGIKYAWDASTLPVTIVRTGNQAFTVDAFKINGSNAWKDRAVGDNTTNPIPSFDGKKISQTFFHRNRLGFLSEGNVILSQSGDLGNFFNDSALLIGASDPIDIAASSTTPTVFKDAIETTLGLVVFADNQQFLLHTDSDLLTPETGKLNNIATYNYNPSAPPITLGTTLGFTDNAGNYTRFFEMFDIRREGEPQIIEQTKVVHRLLPNNINRITNSRENSTVFFFAKDTNVIYGYRYFNSGKERVQSAWFRWVVPYSCSHSFFLDDTLYLVTTDYKLLRVDLNTSSVSNNRAEISGTDFFDDSLVYPIFLDSWSKLTIGGSSEYSSATDLTRVSKSSVTLAGNGTLVMMTDPVGYFAPIHSQDGSYYYFRGNYTGSTVYIGYLFDMIVEFPRLFVKTKKGDSLVADVTAALTLHRLKMKFGAVGYYQTELKRKGKPAYTCTYDSRYADSLDADELAFVSEYLQAVPVYERSSNVKLTLKSTHPSPATLYSLTWEGDYSNMHYRRV